MITTKRCNQLSTNVMLELLGVKTRKKGCWREVDLNPTPKQGFNRCCLCNLFRSWHMLRVYEYIPDNQFGGENFEYICLRCKKDLK